MHIKAQVLFEPRTIAASKWTIKTKNTDTNAANKYIKIYKRNIME